MKIVKMLIRCLAMISLAVTVATGELIAAIILLAFSSASFGIMIGQKIKE